MKIKRNTVVNYIVLKLMKEWVNQLAMEEKEARSL